MSLSLLNLRHLIVSATFTLLLLGCGFHLRQVQPILITPLFIEAPQQQVFARMLRRALKEHPEVIITDNAKDAKFRLKLISEGLDRKIQALSTDGRVREVTLRDNISFQVLTQAGEELLPATSVSVERVVSYDDRYALAKVNDEAMVYKEMQEDGIRLLILRLNALHPELPHEDAAHGEQK
jgi:LPS-assembly lipoprotein